MPTFEIDLTDKTILLTGGTGSFGRAFTRRVISHWPSATIRIFSRDELKQSEMAKEFNSGQLRYLIGDIRDRYRLKRASEGVNYIIHAAAMKQVPACEYNPFEAVQTNVLGAQNVVDAAIDTGVDQVIGISTDKAVNPINLYGATKLCAEKIMVHGNAYAPRLGTRISCVRYGNVVGSRGSVVTLFRDQAKDGMLTVTDPRMTRFWITLDQAVELVFYALAHQVGGEVFVPRIPSMRVPDLAEAMAPGILTKTVGIRPGEKLHELLVTADESRHAVRDGDVYVILPEHPWYTDTRWGSCQPLPDGFAYSSETNDSWLTIEELSQSLP